jgi:anti-sigma factor RsiW
MLKLDDSILVAYVDSELDAAASDAVRLALERDADAQRRVRALRLSASLLRSAFDDPALQAVPADIAQALRRPLGRDRLRRAARIGAVAASLAGAAALGYLGAAVTGEGFDSRLADEIAEYQPIFAQDREHQVELAADRRTEIEAWLGGRLHRRLAVPDLTAYGLAFRGARLLVVEGRPVADLLFVWPDRPDQPLALCIAVGDPGTAKVKTHAAADGLALAGWRRDGYSYVLAGWAEPGFLDRLARSLMPDLDRR